MRRRRLRFSLLVLVSAAAPLGLATWSCGSSGSNPSGPSGSGGTGGAGVADAGDAGNTGGGGGTTFQDQSSCTSGQPCGDGGVCVSGMCCDSALACGDTCCNAGDVCSFQKCVAPGAPCHDSSDCSPSEYCEQSLGDNDLDAGPPDGSCVGGAAELNGKCLPKPPTCAPDAGPPDGGALDCLEECEFHPMGSFSPVLKFAWGGQLNAPNSTDVMMTPVVIELDDDDCDGKITEKDIPEIVFSTFSGGNYSANGTLHAISIVNGVVVDKWSAGGVNPTKQLAAGNIDGMPGNEIIACGVDGAVHAFTGTGAPLWTSAPMTCFMPSIADLDGDGDVEVVVEGGILDGASGALEHAFSSPLNGPFVVSDIDGDGQLDVVTSSRGYHADGTLFVDTGIAFDGTFSYGNQDWKGPWSAVADLDKDGKPEVVVVDNQAHAISVWRYDANQPQSWAQVRAPADINAMFPQNTCPPGNWGATHGGGPPTIADFDGDGTPDVGCTSGIGYIVFDGKKLIDPLVSGAGTILWAKPTTDCSSASTGSSVFDFDGDGKAEVVYSDENHVRVYEGPTGNELVSLCNTTATLIEYPVIADVDNDGHADIVVVSNAYAKANPEFQCNDGMNIAQSGVRIFGDQNLSWVRTRRVWNEHAYHVSNVEEDGTIPQHEPPNWTQTGLNNFRQNKQPGSEFSAPDAVVSLAPLCFGTTYGLVATVRNIGQAALPAGVVVGYYMGQPGSGTLLGKSATTKVLYSAESEGVVLPIDMPDPAITNGTVLVYAVVDDTQVAHPSWHECRTDNNVSEPVSGACSVPQ